jgi:hypothetical protein
MFWWLLSLTIKCSEIRLFISFSCPFQIIMTWTNITFYIKTHQDGFNEQFHLFCMLIYIQEKHFPQISLLAIKLNCTVLFSVLNDLLRLAGLYCRQQLLYYITIFHNRTIFTRRNCGLHSSEDIQLTKVWM